MPACRRSAPSDWRRVCRERDEHFSGFQDLSRAFPGIFGLTCSGGFIPPTLATNGGLKRPLHPTAEPVSRRLGGPDSCSVLRLINRTKSPWLSGECMRRPSGQSVGFLRFVFRFSESRSFIFNKFLRFVGKKIILFFLGSFVNLLLHFVRLTPAHGSQFELRDGTSGLDSDVAPAPSAPLTPDPTLDMREIALAYIIG